MQKIIEKILKRISKKILIKQRPFIVSITGSMGKTSAKEAIAVVLSKKFKVRKNIKNYNNELGVPLTIIGEKPAGKSLFGWIEIFLKGILLYSFKNKEYPEMLVLETAADKPGDLKYLIEMFPKKYFAVAVLTAIAPVHLEFFKTIENIFKEKISPFSYLPEKGWGVVNIDDCDFKRIKKSFSCRFLSYGFNNEADIKAEDVKIDRNGLVFSIVYKGKKYECFLANACAKHQVYAVLAGFSLGIIFNLNPEEIIESLKSYKIISGRMYRLEGIKGITLIDDTYNSSPQAAKKALEALKEIPTSNRRIAVLGDMLELGEKSENFHRQLGTIAIETGIDYIICVGKQANFIFNELIKSKKFNGQVVKFPDAEKAANFLKQTIEPEDVLLVKGSRGMHMEKIVEELA